MTILEIADITMKYSPHLAAAFLVSRLAFRIKSIRLDIDFHKHEPLTQPHIKLSSDRHQTGERK